VIEKNEMAPIRAAGPTFGEDKTCKFRAGWRDYESYSGYPQISRGKDFRPLVCLGGVWENRCVELGRTIKIRDA
jgi:hypothetical protein